MAAFINNDITTAGLIVLAKGVAGQKINYTKIVLGDGYLEEGQTPRTLTGVVSPKATVDITKLKINGDGTVAVGGIFTNGDETDGFYYRELGLYAEDPDPEVGEVLYCYGNCGDLAEWIPPSGGATIVEKTIDIVTAIGTATNVTAYIPADAYATKEDYETYKAIALGAQATASNGHSRPYERANVGRPPFGRDKLPEMQVITDAKELEKHTYIKTRNPAVFPKKERLGLAQRMMNEASDLVADLMEANDLLLTDPEERELRYRAQRSALRNCRKLIHHIELAHEILSGFSDDAFAYWAKMAAGVKNQTAKWYKTDKERAAKLDAQKRHQ